MYARRLIATAGMAFVGVGVAGGTAWADSCSNKSRPAPAGYTSSTVYPQPLVQGGWVWLPSLASAPDSVTQIPAYWGKITPGTDDAVLLGAPDANGNYTNGQTISLLGVSAVCNADGQAFVVRQTQHGIQSGCE